MTAKKTPRRKSSKKVAAKKPAKPTAIKPGDVIERKFKGKRYRLRVTDSGFALGKQKFRSLTSAAKHVTQYKSISGVRFWLGGRGGAK